MSRFSETKKSTGCTTEAPRSRRASITDTPHCHFVANALGTIYDSRGVDSSWNSRLKVAFTKDAAKNVWTAELAVPWSDVQSTPASGAILRGNFLRNDIVQASLEAIAYRFAIIYGRILPHLPPSGTHHIIGSGGGLLGSPAWMQIFADVLGEPLLALREKEATSRGLALLALEHLGVIDRPSALPPATGDTYEPSPQRHAVYQQAVQRQAELYARLLD